MLDLYRFNNADLEDVKLQDPTKTDVYNDGMWLTPVGNAAQQWAMSATGTENTDAPTSVAKMIFMEKGRSDAKAVGKMTCVSGAGVRGKTDVFIVNNGLVLGAPLTIKKDADNVVKLALAGAGDTVKAFVFLSPSADPDGLLHFELVR